VPLWIRPHLMPPEQAIASIESTNATYSDVSAGPRSAQASSPGSPARGSSPAAPSTPPHSR
jgi:hypothetical protein